MCFGMLVDVIFKCKITLLSCVRCVVDLVIRGLFSTAHCSGTFITTNKCLNSTSTVASTSKASYVGISCALESKRLYSFPDHAIVFGVVSTFMWSCEHQFFMVSCKRSSDISRVAVFTEHITQRSTIPIFLRRQVVYQ